VQSPKFTPPRDPTEVETVAALPKLPTKEKKQGSSITNNIFKEIVRNQRWKEPSEENKGAKAGAAGIATRARRAKALKERAFKKAVVEPTKTKQTTRSNCAVYDFTEFSGGKYKCNDSGMIEVDENLDGIVENTMSLPTDENGCYYEDCDDDDNDDATCEDGSYTGYEKWFCDTSHTDDMGNGNLYHGICGDSCSDHCHTYDFTEATGYV